MSVSDELQQVITDVSALIAAGASPGRTELEKMRRGLSAIAADARKAEADTTTQRMIFAELLTGVEGRIIDLTGLATRARKLAGMGAATREAA